MTVVYWAACAWVIQNTFNERHEELSRKLTANIELDWLDFRASFISQRTAVSLSEAPGAVKVVYVVGATIMMGTVQAFQWGYSYLFGTFTITDNDIDDLKMLDGDTRIIKETGLVVFIALFAGFFGKVCFDMWAFALCRWLKNASRLDPCH